MKQPPPADTTRLFLVRHGATDANESRPYILQGRGVDLPLNERGRQQAQAVAGFLDQFPVTRVFASPLQRAVETGRAIAAQHDLDVVTDDCLAECDVGEWEGCTWEAIMRDHPEAYQNFMNDPSQHPYLGGESYADVLHRVAPAIEVILEKYLGETVVVVAHNVVNRVYLAKLLGLELRCAKDLRQANACVNWIRFRGGETNLLTMNAIFHLDGLVDP